MVKYDSAISMRTHYICTYTITFVCVARTSRVCLNSTFRNTRKINPLSRHGGIISESGESYFHKLHRGIIKTLTPSLSSHEAMTLKTIWTVSRDDSSTQLLVAVSSVRGFEEPHY